MKKTVHHSNKSGWTATELIFVVVILGIIVAIVIPKVFSLEDHAEQASEEYVIGAIQEALLVYQAAQTVK